MKDLFPVKFTRVANDKNDSTNKVRSIAHSNALYARLYFRQQQKKLRATVAAIHTGACCYSMLLLCTVYTLPQSILCSNEQRCYNSKFNIY